MQNTELNTNIDPPASEPIASPDQSPKVPFGRETFQRLKNHFHFVEPTTVDEDEETSNDANNSYDDWQDEAMNDDPTPEPDPAPSPDPSPNPPQPPNPDPNPPPPHMPDELDLQRSILLSLLRGETPVDIVHFDWFNDLQQKILSLLIKYGPPISPIHIQNEYRHLDSHTLTHTLCELELTLHTSPMLPKSVIAMLENNRLGKIALKNTEDVVDIITKNGNADELRRKLQEGIDALATKEDEIPIVDVSTLVAAEPPLRQMVIENILAIPHRMMIVGPSKTFKTHALNQLAHAIATGSPLWGLQTHPRKVLVVHYEDSAVDYHHRIYKMGLSLAANMMISMNGAEEPITLDAIESAAKKHKPGVIFIDPLYCIPEWDEMDKKVLTGFLMRIRQLSIRANASIIYAHHDPKGVSGDKRDTDRGSGGGELGRFWDATMMLDPHSTLEGGAITVRWRCRHWASPPSFTLRYDSGSLVRDDSVEPTPETSRSRASKMARGPSIEDLSIKALEILADRTIGMGDFRSELSAKLSIGEHKVRGIISNLRLTGKIKESQEHFKGGGIKVSKVRQDSASAKGCEPTKG